MRKLALVTGICGDLNTILVSLVNWISLIEGCWINAMLMVLWWVKRGEWECGGGEQLTSPPGLVLPSQMKFGHCAMADDIWPGFTLVQDIWAVFALADENWALRHGRCSLGWFCLGRWNLGIAPSSNIRLVNVFFKVDFKIRRFRREGISYRCDFDCCLEIVVGFNEGNHVMWHVLKCILNISWYISLKSCGLSFIIARYEQECVFWFGFGFQISLIGFNKMVRQ